MSRLESTGYTNLDVIDRDGHKVGTVSDVVSDVATLDPIWLVVDVGVLKSSHYLPAALVQQNDEGQLMIPFDKETVKTATKPNKGHVLGAEEDRELREHYGMSDS